MRKINVAKALEVFVIETVDYRDWDAPRNPYTVFYDTLANKHSSKKTPTRTLTVALLRAGEAISSTVDNYTESVRELNCLLIDLNIAVQLNKFRDRLEWQGSATKAILKQANPTLFREVVQRILKVQTKELQVAKDSLQELNNILLEKCAINIEILQGLEAL